MHEVKRYDYGYVDDGNGSRYLGLIERDTGKLVRHDDYDALHAETEALRAENGRMAETERALIHNHNLHVEKLEAARGLLRHASSALGIDGWESLSYEIDTFLTATPAPEVRCQTCDGTGDVHRSDGEWLGECHCVKTEQGARQEAVAWYTEDHLTDKSATTWSKDVAERWRAKGWPVGNLYTTPQPGPDARWLAASLYQACGAYDMPERILDVLSAAANCEPFAHMIDGLLPCVPPSDQDVRSLLSADDVRDACANAVSVFAEEANADQCREVAEYMREVLLAQIAKQQAKGKGGKHE